MYKDNFKSFSDSRKLQQSNVIIFVSGFLVLQIVIAKSWLLLFMYKNDLLFTTFSGKYTVFISFDSLCNLLLSAKFKV